ncbi:unnamed protein product [Pleuronectes platessa]|uniref:Uncharacterized protein n=1 Tax=Pleuronectes platessa TaxID=8262 RepID=A0A9N7UDA1_PLEPL|nr:unnamed protein product [Pleuronectes platessa]
MQDRLSSILARWLPPHVQGEKKPLQSQHMEQSGNASQSRWSAGRFALQHRPWARTTVQADKLRQSLNAQSGGGRPKPRTCQRNEHNQYAPVSQVLFVNILDIDKDFSDSQMV